MAKFIVSGLLNMETTCRVRSFPVNYYPIDYPFFGVDTTASGVALNIAGALTRLGDEVDLYSLIGCDLPGELIARDLASRGISADHVQRCLEKTPNSVVLYDEEGKRQIYCDLKNIQETACDFDRKMIEAADAVLVCNINFSRPLLHVAKNSGKLIATDLHVLSNPDDEYNREFLELADIAFLSDEGINGDCKDFLRALGCRYRCRLFVLGMGAKGAMIYQRQGNRFLHRPACSIGVTVNTVGAGDALFSSFMHFYLKNGDPDEALDRAQLFAALKIRTTGAASGFVTEEELERFSQGNSV
ncbi:MAG: carbohydrate kinase family protein [Succinivibrionaceae bacterium]|nr:carbohydrate kinase family protein [Succinivibrionaceae bacterium]